MDRCDCARIGKSHRFSYSNRNNSQTKPSWLLAFWHMYWTPIFSKSMIHDWFYLICSFYTSTTTMILPLMLTMKTETYFTSYILFQKWLVTDANKFTSLANAWALMSLFFCSKAGCTSSSALGRNEHVFVIKLYELTTSNGITLDLLVYCVVRGCFIMMMNTVICHTCCPHGTIFE